MRNTKLTVLLIALIGFSIGIFLFHLMRLSHNPYMPVYDQYNHVAQITGQRPVDFLLNTFIPQDYDFYMRALPFIVGLVNILLIFLILYSADAFHRKSVLMYIILSPVFIYVHTIYSPLFLSLMLLLLGTYFAMKDLYLLSLFSYIVTFIITPHMFFPVLILLLVLFERFKGKWMIAAAGVVLATYVFITTNAAIDTDISPYVLLTTYISDLSPGWGIGIFSLLLSLVGIFVSWKRKKEYALYYIILVSLTIATLYDKNMMLFLDLLLAYFAGLAFSSIWKGTWKSPLLKNYVLLLIFCGLLFSAGSFVKKLSETGPSQAEIISLRWLDKGKVLSHYEFGYLIESLENTPYIGKDYYLHSIDKSRIKDAQNIFMSRNYEEVTAFLKKNDIDYIWTNQAMREGLVWKNEGEGMLFVMENSRDFIKIYDYRDIIIWKYQQ